MLWYELGDELAMALHSCLGVCPLDVRRSCYISHFMINQSQSFHLQLWSDYYPVLMLSDDNLRRALPAPALDIYLEVEYGLEFFPHSLYNIVNFPHNVPCVLDLSGEDPRDFVYLELRNPAALISTEELSVGPLVDEGLQKILESTTHRFVPDDDGIRCIFVEIPVIPKLSTLLLHHINMRPLLRSPSPDPLHSLPGSSQQSPRPVSTFLRDLMSALHKRKRGNYRLKQLIIRDCTNVFQEDIDALQAVADNVDWDGKPVILRISHG